MRLVLITLCVSAVAHASAPASWTTSPCLAASPSKAVHVVTVRDGGAWYLDAVDPVPVENVGPAQLACVDEAIGSGEGRQRVLVIRAHVAIVLWVRGADLVEVSGRWAAYRSPDDEPGETGCLRRFKPGTRLFDRPDGDVVGLVVDRAAFLGKWDSAKTAAGWWAMTRVRPHGAWLRVPSGRDWCQ